MGAVRAPGRRGDDGGRAAAAPPDRRARGGAALSRARPTPAGLTRLARLLLLLAVLAVAAFTLGSPPSADIDLFTRLLGRALESTPLTAGRLTQQRSEFAANALLFLPLGVLLPPALPRAPLTLLLAVPVLGSLGVEVLQLLVVTGRTPDLVDVVANGLGGALGLLVGADVVRLVSRSSPS